MLRLLSLFFFINLYSIRHNIGIMVFYLMFVSIVTLIVMGLLQIIINICGNVPQLVKQAKSPILVRQ